MDRFVCANRLAHGSAGKRFKGEGFGLPSTHVSLSLYRINRCGYYKWGVQDPEFGEISTAFSDLLRWARGKDIGDSCPYNPEQEDAARTYCFGVRADSRTGDSLLTLWNESPSDDGRLASVTLSSKVGEPEVQHVDTIPGTATGFPTYFWIIPSHRLLATLRVGRLPGGKWQMEKYMRAFLSRFAGSYVVYDESVEDEVRVAGYRGERNAVTRSDLHARFGAVPIPNPTVIDYLRQRLDSIEGIVGETELRATANVQGNVLRGLLETMGIMEPRDLAQAVQVRYDVSYRPSAEELNAMISAAAAGDSTGIGFRVDGRIVWLRDAHFRMPLELTWSGDPLQGSRLFNELKLRRDEIVNQLQPSVSG